MRLGKLRKQSNSAFKEESPPRAEGDKVLPLRARLDVKGGGHVVDLWAWLAADVHRNDAFLAVARGLAHLLV